MYLGLLCVDPSQQSKGLGRKLMNTAEEFAINAGCVAMDLKTISPRNDIVTGTSPMPADVVMAVPSHFVHMSKSLVKAQGAR